MRHINDLKNEIWFSRPWLLLGTGPSLDKFNQDEWDGYNIAAIYDAYFACNYVDLLFISDLWDPNKKYYWVMDNVRYVATRNINAHLINGQENVVMWDYTCDSPKLFDEYEVYPCSNTSSFAVMYLGKMGIKEIKTYGIDGGKGVSKYVSNEYKNSIIKDYNEGLDYDFSIENQGVFGHARDLGINLIRQ